MLVFGGYTPDQLANEGEQLKLSYGAGLAIHDFEYGIAAPWPTDLAGRSIALLAPETRPAYSDGANWRASAQPGGTPGRGDEQPVDGYAAWKASHGIVSDEEDSDRDGLTAFMEYVTGSDPNVASTERLPAFSYDAAAGTLRAIVYHRIGTAEASYDLESSTDLLHWEPAEVESSSVSELDDVERIDRVLAIDGSDQKFFRLTMRRN
jgi:hypothetical protein